MMTDQDEPKRAAHNGNERPASREELERKHGKVWDEQEMRAEFDVIGTVGAKLIVMRRCDSRLGSLTFQDSPRYYFAWVLDITP